MAAERKRGCGYRKVGGLYLCADGPGEPCHRLPVPLEVCPTCHAGFKQTRGWTWVKPEPLLGGNCEPGTGTILHCAGCPACKPYRMGEKAGLIWIGEKFYKTPGDFTREAVAMGVSRRITAIPKGFKVGGHYVLVAHPKAIVIGPIMGPPIKDNQATEYRDHRPGIFHVFKPTRIEKIVKQSDFDVVKKIQDAGGEIVMISPEEQEVVDQYNDDFERGVTWVPVPDDDPDHRGTVYDDNGEDTQVLDLDEVKGVL